MSINTNTLRTADRRAPLKIQFQQGYYAFLKGWLVNQYELVSVQGQEWQRGFDAAYFEQLDHITKKA
jgi:hypothetical protein